MIYDFNAYADLIVSDLLKLKKGDALSINTEEVDFEFAKTVANCALSVTDVQVKIVVTDNGKPVDVSEFDPKDSSTPVTSMALLRIAHVKVQEDVKGNVLENYPEKDDLVAIQKFNHLAEPVVLNRRIAIAYCVVPSVPVEYSQNVNDKVLVVDYRKKFLNHEDIDTLHFIGEGTDFTVDIPNYNYFDNSHIHLSSGRDFICSTDIDSITCLVDKNSINGYLEADCEIFGRKQKLRLEYKAGKLVSATDSNSLKKLLSFDNDISKPGYLIMKDKGFILSLGGGLLSNFEKEPEAEESIPGSFNTSLYCLKLNLDSKINLFYLGCDGKEHELVRKGFFLQ